MSFEVRVRYSEEILRRASRRFLWRYMGRDAVLGPAGFVLALVLWFGLGVREWYVVALGGGGVLLGGMALLAGALFRSRAVARFRQMTDPTVVWHFSDEGLATESELGRVEAPWSAVTKLWRFPEAWLLFFGAGGYSTLPADDLGADVRAFIEARVRDAGGQVR